MILHDTIRFFRQEKKYAVLLLLLLATYGMLAVWQARSGGEPLPDTSRAVEQFKQAESQVMKNFEDADSVEKYLEEHPEFASVLRFLVFLVAGLFSMGLFVLFALVFNPSWRRKIEVEPFAEDSTRWQLSMLFKAILLFLASTLGLNVLLGLLHRYVFPAFSMNFIILLQTTLVDLLCLFFLIYIVRQYGGKWTDLGLRRTPRGGRSEAAMGIIGYLGVFPVFASVLLFLVAIAHFFSYEPPPHPLVNIILEEQQRSPWLIGYSVILATVIAPMLEEVFFRGFCYPIFKRRWGKGAGILLSALFFAAIHNSTFAFWPIFVLGLALAYIYEKRKSLIAPIVLHLVHNSVFIIYFFLAKYLVTAAS